MDAYHPMSHGKPRESLDTRFRTILVGTWSKMNSNMKIRIEKLMKTPERLKIHLWGGQPRIRRPSPVMDAANNEEHFRSSS
mmetsp:Transcript_4456/g.10488  ORF Transcript_4456/g.10488 Transcript_4456/m.10488 type:complete len:81 (+) Transcript_4456:291-533(+)